MLRKISKEISERCRLAEQARKWAEEATDFRIRQDYLSVERSWLLLARCSIFGHDLFAWCVTPFTFAVTR